MLQKPCLPDSRVFLYGIVWFLPTPTQKKKNIIKLAFVSFSKYEKERKEKGTY